MQFGQKVLSFEIITVKIDYDSVCLVSFISLFFGDFIHNLNAGYTLRPTCASKSVQ